MQAGEAQVRPVLAGEHLAHTVGRHLRCAIADLHPLCGGLTAGLDRGAQLRGLAARVGEVLGAGQADKVNVGITKQRQHPAVQSGMANDNDLLHLGVDHVVIRGDLRAAEDVRCRRMHRVIRRRRGGLRDGRHVLEPLDLPCLIAGHHQRVAGQVHGHLAVVGPARRAGPVLSAIGGLAGQRSAHQGHVERHVDVHLPVSQEALGHEGDVRNLGDLGGLGKDAEEPGLLNGL